MQNVFSLLFLYHKIAVFVSGILISVLFLAAGHSLNVSDESQMYLIGHIVILVVSPLLLFTVRRNKPRQEQNALYITAIVCLIVMLFSLGALLYDALKVTSTSGSLVKGIVLSLVIGIINNIFILFMFMFRSSIVLPKTNAGEAQQTFK
jgi:hypothetical protein